MKHLFWNKVTNKALLWKEWRQNRWKFLGALIIMSFTPIINTVQYWLMPSSYGSSEVYWSQGILRILVYGSENSIEFWGMFVALGLGALMLGQERESHALEFIAAAPFSRRQIIVTKFILGTMVIVGIMLINALFMILAASLLPALYTVGMVIKWFLLTTVTLLVIFSFTLMLSTVTGNVLAAGGISLLFLFLPMLLQGMVVGVFRSLGFIGANSGIENLSEVIAKYVTIPRYLEYPAGFYTPEVGRLLYQKTLPPDYWGIVSILLLAIVLFLVLAVFLFERNPLEKRGEILMFGNFKRILQVSLAILTAWMGASIVIQYHASSGIFVGSFLVILVGTYFLVNLVYRVQRN